MANVNILHADKNSEAEIPLKGKNVKKTVLQDLLNFSSSSDENTDEPSAPPALHSKSAKQFAEAKTKNAPERKTKSNKENVDTGSTSQRRGDTEGGLGDSKMTVIGEKPEGVGHPSVTKFRKPTTKQNNARKAACMGKKNKLKARSKLHNTTLASLGIACDFSGSSDEDEGKCEKEQLQLTHKETSKIPASFLTVKPRRKNMTDECQAMRETSVVLVVKDEEAVDQQTSHLKDPSVLESKAVEGKPADFEGENTDMQAKSSAPISSANRCWVKSENLDLKTASKYFRNSQSGNTCALSGKHYGQVQHPEVSFIKASQHSSSLFADASPSEESLLPLSESTRLDCLESAKAPKQSFGHLLAHQNSPLMFDVSAGNSQDSSYEQLKIVTQKKARESGSGADEVQHERGKDKNALELTTDKQADFATETSSSESQYVTCLATPDASSLYEVVDVSVQTSFQSGVLGMEEKLQVPTNTRCDDIHGAVQTHDDNGLVTTEDKCAISKRSKVGTVMQVAGDCLATGSHQHCGWKNSAETSSQDMHTSVKGKSDGEVTDDIELPDLTLETEKCTKVGPGSVSHGVTEEKVIPEQTLDTGSPHPEQHRSRLPSDSNYFSKSGSAVNSFSGCVDASESSDKKSDEQVFLFPSKHSSTGSKISKERPFSTTEESCRVRRPPSQEDSPAELMTATDKWRNNHGIEGMSASRQAGRKAGVGDSSSEDEDDKLEAFFQKVRLPAKPAKDTTEKKDGLENFIVNDSDVTESDATESEEDDCEADFTSCLDADQVFLPRTRQGSARQTRAQSVCAQSKSSSEEDDSECSTNDDDSDDDDNELCYGELTTPKSRTRPTFSKTQTPREDGLKWYTPATSMKTKPRHNVDSSRTLSTSEVQAKVCDDGWKTPACLSRAANRNTGRSASFLRSLSMETPDHLRDREALSFISQFKRRQEELSSRLFKLFNFTVFENQLPTDMPVVWNKRLLKTAGLCKLKRLGDRYTAAIELSTKVCDSAERVRDTLVHEMCHAAVWIINRAKEGHGPHWRYWARKANRAHPEIPVIRRCHDYSISTKYIYRCVKCGYQIGRHSKSLDTEKKVCGHCRGRFQLLVSGSRNTSSASLPATPRTPNPFAQFVKENYGSVKKQGGGLPHKQVMDMLSKQFAKTKINFD